MHGGEIITGCSTMNRPAKLRGIVIHNEEEERKRNKAGGKNGKL